jgi:hypothetical protein
VPEGDSLTNCGDLAPRRRHPSPSAAGCGADSLLR